MNLKAKALAGLGWVWSWLVWAWAKIWGFVTAWKDYVVDPPAAHLKVYFWIVLGGSLASYFFWASIVGAFNWIATPMRQAMAPVPHVMSAPESFLVIPSQMPDKLADAPKPVDLAPLKVTTLPAKVTTPDLTPANTGKVAPKMVTSPVTKVTPRKHKEAAASPFPN